jgi:hypothetical protein
MRQGQNNRRSRGRSNNRRSNAPNRNQTFDSNGPDTRIRGNASQVLEKYQALARDAMSSGDPVMVENYLQHAEHYQRVINQMNEAVAQAQLQAEQAREQRPQQHPNQQSGQNPNQQPVQQSNGRAQPMRDSASDRKEPAGATFEPTSSDPREQPTTEFGRDPREEAQPKPNADSETSVQTPAPPPTEAPAQMSAQPEEAAKSETPVEKPRRRRPRRVKVEEAVSEQPVATSD